MSPGVDVVVIGGGPAGLSAATRLRERGVSRVLVVEREARAGGVPRHCAHPGFGVRDLHRFLSGPRYAEELVRRATSAGVDLWTSTTVTDMDASGIDLTSRVGTRRVDARAVILATGARERPRSARLVAGDRPWGVFTTGQLQQWVFLERLTVGRRALVVGAEHVSFSAIMTLRHAGVSTVGLVTELARHQSVAGAGLLARGWGARLMTTTRLVDIVGRRRVESVTLQSLLSGRTWSEPVDTVVFTGEWIPDHELARRAGVRLDPGTLGPSSDAGGRTNLDTVYATGNVLHPVQGADVVALGARKVADVVADELLDRVVTPRHWLEVRTQGPIAWVWPNRIEAGVTPPILRLRTSAVTAARRLEVISDSGRVLAASRLRSTTPHRSLVAPSPIREALGESATTVRLS